MITIKLGQEEFKLPNCWDEVTFGQFIDILNINKDKWNDTMKFVKVLGILSRQNKDELWLNLGIDNFRKVQDEFLWMIDKPEPKTKEFFEIEGKKYTIKKDYNGLNVGEMVSLETLLKEKPDYDEYEIVFGILFREVGEDGKIKEFEIADVFNYINKFRDKIKITDVIGVVNFFLPGGTKSITKSIPVSLEIIKDKTRNGTPKEKNSKKKKKKADSPGGVGLHS